MGKPGIWIDLSQTAHTAARTGVQQLSIALWRAAAAAGPTRGTVWDSHWRCWRDLSTREKCRLSDQPAAGARLRRGARWTWREKLTGRWQRLTGQKPVGPAGGRLVVPEIFTLRQAAAYDRWPGAGPRVAVFNDPIPLLRPDLTPPGTVARFPGYLKELSAFDGIAAISRWSAESLAGYWDWLGLTNRPDLRVIEPGVDPRPPDWKPRAYQQPPTFLCVGTFEARKNHLALLAAAEQLWRSERPFNLVLVGGAVAASEPIVKEIDRLRQAGYPLTWAGVVTNHQLELHYRNCEATIYPSLLEGYGLPVRESLRWSRPCLCGNGGALAEAARLPGVEVLPQVTATALAEALARFLDDSQYRSALFHSAWHGRVRTWGDYAAELLGWAATLTVRPDRPTMADLLEA